MNSLFKKFFWVIFVIIFVIVAIFVTKVMYSNIYLYVIKQETERFAFNPFLFKLDEKKHSESYKCSTDKSVSKRGYLYIHGFGGLDTQTESLIKNSTNLDNKNAGFVTFKYDGAQNTLSPIGEEFVSELEDFASIGFDEIIIFAESAGGIIASFSAHKLDDSTHIEIHTLASPLNGYKFGKYSEAIAQDKIKFEKEIASGIEPYKKPTSNIKVYHHKTVTDDVLSGSCGPFSAFCKANIIQDNNVPGSTEYFYPDETHSSIVKRVVDKVVECSL